MSRERRVMGTVVMSLAVVAFLVGWQVTTSRGAPKTELQAEAVGPQVARSFSRVLPRAHLKHLPIDDEMAASALTNYLNSLDYDRTFFLASDIEEFARQAPALDDRLQKGDPSMGARIFDRFRERVRDREAFVDKLLTAGLDLTKSESYRWKRKDVPWAASAQEWDELWRLKIKNEYVSLVVAQRLAAEDRTNQAAAAQAAATIAAPPVSNAVPAAGVSTNAAGTNRVAAVDLSPEQTIRKRYQQYRVILEDSDGDMVLQRYLTAYAQAYDPHSDYMSASTAEDFDIGMKLSLQGIGALLSSDDGAAKIERVIPGSPAARDGRLKDGDRIIAVGQGDGELVDVMHWPLHKTVRLIRGPKGTRVVLKVIPASDISGSVTALIDLVRDEIQLEEQAAKGRVESVVRNGVTNRLGVITLPAFYVDMRARGNGRGSEFRSSTRDIAKLLIDLEAKGVDGMVLDLRNNGGGSLPEAVEMTGLFLPSGPIVQVKETRGVQVLSDPDPDILYRGPLVVLVSRQSASASEILAGALQDYGRAVLVGDSKTHGKGTVQSLFNLDDRDPRLGSLKVTMASFHRVGGGSTQMKGIVPDIVIPSVLDELEIGEEYLPHAFPWSTVGAVPFKPFSDLQPMLPELRKRSEARRKDDLRFAAQAQVLARFEERQKSTVIPLQLEERLALARAEKGLNELEEKALRDTAEDGAPAEGDSTPDLILDESLRILCDFVELSETGD